MYGQDQLQLGQLFVTVGGRYDWVDTRYLTPFVAVGTPGDRTKVDERKFTWRAGANYVLPGGIAPYVSYSTSFEPVLGTDAVTGAGFKPTTGRQWEGGVKYDARGLPSDVKLFATAAAFDIKQKNVVSTTPSALPEFGTQSGEVEVYGGEVELVARIHDQWSINGSYSYNHSEVLASTVPAEIGQPLPTTPRHKASVFVNYDLQTGDAEGPGARRRRALHQQQCGQPARGRSTRSSCTGRRRRCSTRSSATTFPAGGSRSTDRTSWTSAMSRAAPAPRRVSTGRRGRCWRR